MQKLMSIPDLAARLNIAEITIRRLIKRNRIPYHRIGHRYFFTEDDFQIYLKQIAVPMVIPMKEE